VAEKITGQTSDGYHTFDELYEHRSILFIALMEAYHLISWYAPKHYDGSMFDGFVIVGMDLPTGQITYHLHIDPWRELLDKLPIAELDRAPKYDGHTSEDTIDRITRWLREMP